MENTKPQARRMPRKRKPDLFSDTEFGMFTELHAASGKARIAARNRIAERYVSLVKRIAASVRTHIDRAELQQDGAIGLLAAIETFDLSRGNRFSTYATRRIRGAMLDGLRERDHVPRAERKRQAKAVDMAYRLGRDPTDDELAEAGIRPPVIRDVMSISSPIGDVSRGVATIADTLEARPEKSRDIAWLLRGMTGKEKLILKLRFVEELTMKAIGRAVGITESRVSQVIALLLARLRDTVEKPEGWGRRMVRRGK